MEFSFSKRGVGPSSEKRRSTNRPVPVQQKKVLWRRRGRGSKREVKPGRDCGGAAGEGLFRKKWVVGKARKQWGKA